MKRANRPPQILGSYEIVPSQELQIEQIKWPDPSEKSPELEAARDLWKLPEQLLADVHREEGNKRLASMMLRVIHSNDRLARRVFALTLVAVVLAAIQTIPVLHDFASAFWALAKCASGR